MIGRLKSAFYSLWWHAQKRGLTAWDPLVPVDAFEAACQRAIAALKADGHAFGDYLEFGVSRGASMACMHKALTDTGLAHVRLIGFDSFEGMPPGSEEEGWAQGAFASSRSATRAYLKGQGVDLGRVELVEGWFQDTCTPETVQALKLRTASLIMVDCDIYSASVDALAFVAPLIGERAVIFLDDWGWRSDIGEVGQKEAFEEFLAANPDLSAREMEAYMPQSRIFMVERRQAGGVS